MDRCKGKYKGIYYREHSTRKNGIRKDRYFYLRYSINGKQREDGFGWESEGFTEIKAFQALCELKENIKKGSGFFSLKEKSDMAKQEKIEIAAEKERERQRNITFSELWETLYKPLYLANKGKKSQQNEQINYDLHIKPVIGDMRIYDITPADIERIKDSMRNKDRAAATINHALACVRQVFYKAIDAGRFSGINPAGNKVKRVRKDNRRIRYLSRDEVNVLFAELAKSNSENLYDMSLLALSCGLRANEVFSIQGADIDFTTKHIAIRDPKGVFNRFANMTNTIYDMLQRRCKNLQPNEYLFKTKDGHKIKEVSNQYQRIVDKLGFNDGVEDIRHRVVFHTLRHTFGSWLAIAGVDVYTIKELMGHSDIKMTMRYMHLSPQKYTSAISVLDNPTAKIENKSPASIELGAPLVSEQVSQPVTERV